MVTGDGANDMVANQHEIQSHINPMKNPLLLAIAIAICCCCTRLDRSPPQGRARIRSSLKGELNNTAGWK